MNKKIMGIGDWAQSPIPNPQSPIPIFILIFNLVNGEIIYNFIFEIITIN